MTESQNPTDQEAPEKASSSEACEDIKAAARNEFSATLGTENYIETYHAISEWIRFADAKAGVILTVGAAQVWNHTF